MNKGTLSRGTWRDAGVLPGVAYVTNRVPPLVASVISGSGIETLAASVPWAGAAVGAAMGAAGMASAAAVTAGAAFASAQPLAAGGASAVFSAFSKAQEKNLTAGTDLMSAFTGGRSSSGGSSDAGVSGTPFARRLLDLAAIRVEAALSGNIDGTRSVVKRAGTRAAARPPAPTKSRQGRTGQHRPWPASHRLRRRARLDASRLTPARILARNADAAMGQGGELARRCSGTYRRHDGWNRIAAAIKARGSGSEAIVKPDQRLSPKASAATACLRAPC